MMTNGPAAGIGDILSVDLPRPRSRLAMADDARFNAYRQKVIEFLHSRHVSKAA
jgi:nitrate/nitrite transport system ATP-binding protein